MAAMQQVDSGAVSHYGYDSNTHILTVKYKSGQTYHYHDVAPATHAKFKEGDSFMGFMRDHVMGKHNHTKL